MLGQVLKQREKLSFNVYVNVIYTRQKQHRKPVF